MSLNLYVTDTEIKSELGISGSSYDTVIAMYNKQATDWLNRELSASDLSLHLVSDEIHDARGKVYPLCDPHVIAMGEILDDETAYTQDETYDIDDYILHLEDGLVQGKRKGHFTYASGWNAAGYATLTVDDYSTIVGADDIVIAPGGSGDVTLTEGSDWNAATSNNVTAASIASAINNHASLGKSSTGIRAFALENVVYIVDKVPQRETSTVVLGTGTGLTLSGSPLTGVDFPESLREAIFMHVGMKIAKRKSKGIKSYRIGTKSVTFDSASDAKEYLNDLVKAYKRAYVHAI